MVKIEKLAAARFAARRKWPYFAAAFLGVRPQEAPGLGTFAVTAGGVLMYDPAFLEAHTVEQLAAVMCHEVGHLLRRHHARAKALNANPRMFNIAGDAELNDDLRAAGAKLPDGCVYPETIGCDEWLTAEHYYHHLLQEQANKKPDKGEGDGDGDGDGKGEGEGAGPDGQGKPGPGRCGSGAGNPVPGEPAENAKDENGKELGRTEAELDRMRRQVAEAVQTAANKNPGSVPGGWVAWAGEQLQPAVVRWEDQLRRAVRQGLTAAAGMTDYTYSRSSRRQAGVGWGPGRPIMPGVHSPMPRVAVVVDTSGSMNGAPLDRAGAEVAGILQATPSKVTFMAADMAVQEVRKVDSWRQLREAFKGGGGTSFVPAFKWFDERPRERPDVLIYLTDGYGGAPAFKPPWLKNAIWVVIGGGPTPATWGKTINVTEED